MVSEMHKDQFPYVFGLNEEIKYFRTQIQIVRPKTIRVGSLRGLKIDHPGQKARRFTSYKLLGSRTEILALP